MLSGVVAGAALFRWCTWMTLFMLYAGAGAGAAAAPGWHNICCMQVLVGGAVAAPEWHNISCLQVLGRELLLHLADIMYAVCRCWDGSCYCTWLTTCAPLTWPGTRTSRASWTPPESTSCPAWTLTGGRLPQKTWVSFHPSSTSYQFHSIPLTSFIPSL